MCQSCSLLAPLPGVSNVYVQFTVSYSASVLRYSCAFSAEFSSICVTSSFPSSLLSCHYRPPITGLLCSRSLSVESQIPLFCSTSVCLSVCVCLSPETGHLLQAYSRFYVRSWFHLALCDVNIDGTRQRRLQVEERQIGGIAVVGTCCPLVTWRLDDDCAVF